MGKSTKILIIAGILIILVAGGFFAWQYFGTSEEKVKAPAEGTPTLITYSKERLPRFEDFSVLERFEGVPAQVDFSTNPDMLRFVTRITEGAKEGPNFAGHYTLISWGCGTECQSGVVVDAQTGAIYSS